GSFRKNLQKELKTWIKPSLAVIFIFGSDLLSEEYISKKNEFEIVGCIQNATFGSGRGHLAKAGLHILTPQGKKEYVNGGYSLTKEMEDHIGECFSFTVYKHSLVIPNVGTQYLISVNPINE
ncbi:TPA: hypothetical protein NJ718_004690, partial [Vibrio parahaemolyticus]|nr:hypothetical protein [Vibrio parahaemolyticus]